MLAVPWHDNLAWRWVTHNSSTLLDLVKLATVRSQMWHWVIGLSMCNTLRFRNLVIKIAYMWVIMPKFNTINESNSQGLNSRSPTRKFQLFFIIKNHFKKRLIHLFLLLSYRKRRRSTNREGFFYLVIYSPNLYNCRGWPRTKPGAWNSTLMWVMGTKYLGHFLLLS